MAHEINGEKLADGVASASDAIKSFFVAANTDNLAIVTLSGKLVVYSLSNGIAAERIKVSSKLYIFKSWVNCSFYHNCRLLIEEYLINKIALIVC